MKILILITVLLNIIFLFYEILEYKQNKKNFIYFLFSCFLIFQAAFRPISSNDDNAVYIRVFKEIIPTFRNYNIFKSYFFEKGYVFLNMIIKTIDLDIRTVFFVMSFISITIISYTINKICKYKFLGMYVYITNFYYINDFIIIRSGVAIALLFLAMTYIERDKIKFFIIITVACTFHKTSILILIPFIFIKFFYKKIKKYNIKKILLILILFFIIGKLSPIYLGLNILKIFSGEKLNYYIQYNNFMPGNYIKLLIYTPILLFFTKYKKKYSNYKYFYGAYSYILMSNISVLFFIENIFFNRIPYIFSISQIYLINLLVSNFKNKKNILILIFLIVVFEILILLWTLRIYIGYI